MLTVHHLQVSQSERIVWLCEELRIKYDLKLHKRAPMFSPTEITALHPLGAAPIIQDGGLTLAESAACTEYIIHKYGNGNLALKPEHKDYATYLYWFHFANGTLQPTLGRLMSLKGAGLDEENGSMKRVLGKLDLYLQYMDDHLAGKDYKHEGKDAAKENEWLAGEEFTAADVMTVFTLTTMRTFYPLGLSRYGNILGYLKRCSEREGYRRAREKGDPELELMVEGPPPVSYMSKIK